MPIFIWLELSGHFVFTTKFFGFPPHSTLPTPEHVFSVLKNWATCLWGESSALFPSHLFFFFGISEACYALKCFHSSWTIKSIITAVCFLNMNGNEWQQAQQTFSFDLSLVIEIFFFFSFSPFPSSFSLSLWISPSLSFSISPSLIDVWEGPAGWPNSPHCCLQLHCINSSNESLTFVNQSHKSKLVLGAIIARKSLPANLWAWLLHLKKHTSAACPYSSGLFQSPASSRMRSFNCFVLNVTHFISSSWLCEIL